MVCTACLMPLLASGGVVGGAALSPKMNAVFLWLSIILSILVIIWAAIKLKKMYK